MKWSGRFLSVALATLVSVSPASVAARGVKQASTRIAVAGGVTVERNVMALAETSRRGVVFAIMTARDGAVGVTMPGFISVRQGQDRTQRLVLLSGPRQAWTGTTPSHETLSLSFGDPATTGPFGLTSLFLAQYN